MFRVGELEGRKRQREGKKKWIWLETWGETEQRQAICFHNPGTHTGTPSVRIEPETDYRLFFQSISIFIPIHNFQG